MISPVAYLLIWNTGHMELCPLGEVQALQLHHSIVLWAVRNMDTLVQRQPIYLPVLMINVRTKRTDPVWTKCESIRVAVICIVKYFFTTHGF